MSGFEDFIRVELPLRQVTIKDAGDPRASEGVVATIGTYYLDTNDNFKRYVKTGSGLTDWKPVPTADDIGSIASGSIDNLTSSKVVDTYDVNERKSAKYLIEIEDTSTGNDMSGSVFFSEVSVVANQTEVAVVEYGQNYTTSEPFVQIQASITNGIVSLHVNNTPGHTNLNNCKINYSKFTAN
jgi:hypothetical protein